MDQENIHLPVCNQLLELQNLNLEADHYQEAIWPPTESHHLLHKRTHVPDFKLSDTKSSKNL